MMTKEERKSVGTLHPKGKMFLRTHMGEAECNDGWSYELALSMSGTPIIRCEQSGRTYTLSWDDILKLAIDAGIAEVESDS